MKIKDWALATLGTVTGLVLLGATLGVIFGVAGVVGVWVFLLFT